MNLVTFENGQWRINDKEKQEAAEKIIGELFTFAKAKKAELESLMEGHAVVDVTLRVEPSHMET